MISINDLTANARLILPGLNAERSSVVKAPPGRSLLSSGNPGREAFDQQQAKNKSTYMRGICYPAGFLAAQRTHSIQYLENKPKSDYKKSRDGDNKNEKQPNMNPLCGKQ